jgi:hypothetical protein
VAEQSRDAGPADESCVAIPIVRVVTEVTIASVAKRSSGVAGMGDAFVAFAIARRTPGLAIPFVAKHSRC